MAKKPSTFPIPTWLIVALVIAGVLLFSSFYTVDQRQQALVVQFGEPKKVVTEPGLNMKIPFIQNVILFDRRLLTLDAPPREVIASDQKRVIVDAFAKFRISDPLLFYQKVRNENGARARLNTIVDSRLRDVIAGVPLQTLLTDKRSVIMERIQKNVSKEADSFGIDVVDVRIMRADLPKENSEAIFRRMQTEREREAKEFRAQGAEEAQRIRSRADRDRAVILAEAEKQSELIRGEGEAKAAKIFAEAFKRDPAFYEFYRSLEAYRKSFGADTTRLVLSPDSDFMKYFKHSR